MRSEKTMTKRIEQAFAKLKQANRAALIPFIMGYDGGKQTTASLLSALPAAGANIIEIGIPFSDPMADGPVIQAAGKRALDAGGTLAGILEIVREFRTQNTDTPIILMGYYNPIYRFGGEKFCAEAVQAGVDGVILVDLPPEEEEELRPYLSSSGLELIRLIAPTSGDDRVAKLSASAGGFVYYISITGITGAKAANTNALKDQLDHMRSFTKLPIAVGFGIKTAEQVAQVAQFADAVVVGSALVDVIAQQKDAASATAAASAFISSLAKGLSR
jgi:tryptophan synthase alpha chain